jgi:putative phage-type endonuclease
VEAAQRAAWLEWRRTNGFGGSDAAAVLGLSKFKSPTQLVLEKRGHIPFGDDSEFFHWRREMEDPILREYSRRTGLTVSRPINPDGSPKPVKSVEHPFMFTTYDGIVVDFGDSPTQATVRRVVQAKTAASKDGWGEPGSDEIPDDYWIQVQHEMATVRAPVADVPVLFHFNRMEIYTVEADEEFQEQLIDAERELWTNITMFPDWMPPVVTIDDAIARWGRASRLGRITANAEVLAAIAELKAIKFAEADLQARTDAAKLVVMNAMGELEAVVDAENRPLLTWKAQAGRMGLDVKKLKADFPEAYAACSKQGAPFRTMLIK